MKAESVTAPFGNMYGPLNTGKILAYKSNLQTIAQGERLNVAPVTTHLVPTLRCNHRCYFCTYGGAKGSINPQGDSRPVANIKNQHQQLDMSFALLTDTLAQLADLKVSGVIFTGGGEPTLYKQLPEAMLRCRELGMDCSLNTNGHALTGERIDKILAAEPTYIRISINAGTPEVQRLITGANDFERVLQNLKELMLRVYLSGKETTVGVAFAVEIVNVYDIKPLVHRVCEISRELQSKHNATFPVNIMVRPVTNYESSKTYDEMRVEEIAAFLAKRSERQDTEDFLSFMYNTQSGQKQTPERILDLAVQTLEELWGNLTKECSPVKVFYPAQKFTDLPRVRLKPYHCCYALPWFLFIWPDGTVYPCVEWAGTPGFELGSLATHTLKEIQTDERRAQLFSSIDQTILSSRCAPICAHHEMNLFLDQIANATDEHLVNIFSDDECGRPDNSIHPSFL